MSTIKIKIVVLLTILGIFTTSSQTTKRNVYLVPGFSGNSDLWDKYDDYFTNVSEIRYYIKTNKVSFYPVVGTDYETIKGRVKSSIPAGGLPVISKNIAMGQSTGGVLLREIDKNEPGKYFGGLITAGSPNHGISIIDNKEVAKNFALDGIAKAENLLTKLNAYSFGISDQISVVETIRANLAAQKETIDGTLTLLTGSADLADHIKKNGIGLNELNSANTSTPKVGIYGIEDGPVHWRALSSVNNENGVWDIPLGDEALTLVNAMRQADDYVSGFQIALHVLTLSSCLNAVFSLGSCFTCDALCSYFAIGEFYLNPAYDDVLTFLRTSESRWNQFIGAGENFYRPLLITRLTDYANELINGILNQYEDCSGGIQLSLEDLAPDKIQSFVIAEPPSTGGGNNCNTTAFVTEVNRILNDPNSYIEELVQIPIPNIN
ncbi:MAG: hypothetical protein ORN85_05535, partial [Sediminibacterium sp.]|nr:hypothetical protein [Sediminibacterium sp.]